MVRIIITPQYFAGQFMDFIFNATMTPELEQQLKDLDVFSMEETTENRDKIIALINTPIKEWLKKEEKVNFFKEVSKDNPDLKEIDGDVYFRDIPVALPANLIEIFKDGSSTNIVNFWYWLSQVPNVSAREEMYAYIGREGLTILDSGLLLCGRRVKKVSNSSDTALLMYAQTTFTKLKSQKKGTNVEVYKNDTGYNLISGVPQGNLKDLHSRGHEVKFTDTHTGMMDYRIMVENRMPREECDHTTGYGPSFYNGGPGFCFNGFGDTPCLTVVNPKDLVEICYDEHKFKSTAFTIVAIMDKDLEYLKDEEIQKYISEIELKFEEQERIDNKQGLVKSTERPDLTNYSKTIHSLLKNW